MEKLYSINKKSIGEFRDRGSKFFGIVFPSANLDQIKNQLTDLQLQYPDATHICYAYRIFVNTRIDEFATDAGEPRGSSGPPLLHALQRNNLINIVIFVIRYYGGTKLGIPGLINAYGVAAENTIENAKKYLWIPKSQLIIEHGYEHLKIIDSCMAQIEGKIVDQKFKEKITTKIEIGLGKENAFTDIITDKSNGLLKVKFL